MEYFKLLSSGEKLLRDNNVDVSLAKFILMESSLLSPDVFYQNLKEKAPKKVKKKYYKYLNLIINKNKPPQYLFKKAYFYGAPFKVNKNVLIPRPESEGLIEIVNKEVAKNTENLKVIDVGTGSGCLAITINKQHPELDVYALDISRKALKVAKYNNKLHKTNVKFIKSDLFKNIKNIKFDIIVANLPYIANDEKLMEMVKQEPKRALMAGDLGLTTYQNFFQEVFNYLKDDGVIAIEHGYLQKEFLEEIILSYRKNAEITALKDLAKKDRYLIIR